MAHGLPSDMQAVGLGMLQKGSGCRLIDKRYICNTLAWSQVEVQQSPSSDSSDNILIRGAFWNIADQDSPLHRGCHRTLSAFREGFIVAFLLCWCHQRILLPSLVVAVSVVLRFSSRPVLSICIHQVFLGNQGLARGHIFVFHAGTSRLWNGILVVLLGGRLGRGLYAVDENLGQSRTSAAIQFCEMEESLTSRVSCDRPPLSSDPFNFATAVSTIPFPPCPWVSSLYTKLICS